MGEMPESLNQAIEAVKAEILGSTPMRMTFQRLDDQSYALRELSRVLAEEGINTSRFTRRTQEVLVAVALNGDY